MTGGNENSTAQRVARDIRTLIEWSHATADHDNRSAIKDLLEAHLGQGESATQSIVSKDISVMEHVNLQLALEEWMAQPGRTVIKHGVFVPRNYGGVDLGGLLLGAGPPAQLTAAPPVTDLPNGPGSTLACYLRVLLLIEDDLGRYVLNLQVGEHEPVLQLEIAGLGVDQAQAVYADLEALRDKLNVYRGHIVQAHATPMGGLRLEFLDSTPLDRKRLILPEAVLQRVETQAVKIANHRDALRGAGQHLKRGVLLYGPPGTGKTHTVRYVLGQMPGYTRLLLQGAALRAIGPAAELARQLSPSVVVLEDVDLVAQDRSFGPGDNPVLFELLDAMDGAAEDSDLLFLLTTNRVEVLEEALATRPGRVDVAVQIDRPDADARARLFQLYAGSSPLPLDDHLVAEVAEATEGVTASFLKELVRRSVLLAAVDDSSLRTMSADHVRRALRDLQDDAQSVTRALLGSGPLNDDDDDGYAEVVIAGY